MVCRQPMDNQDANSRAPQGPDQDSTGRDGAPASASVSIPVSASSSDHANSSGRPAQNSRRALRPLLPMRTRPVSPLAGETEPYWGRPLHLVISAILLTFLLTFIIAVPLVPGQLEIEPGKPAVQSILSPADFSYQSKVLTDKAREQAKNDRANEVWVLDTVVIQRQRSLLENALSVVEDVRQNNAPDAADTGRQRLSNLSSIKLTPEHINMLLVLSDSSYRYWRESAVYPAFD